MIRMYIHKEANIIENKDVVVISDEAIAKMKKRYGDDIEERLKAVNMLFEAIPSLRAENPEQLKERVKSWIKSGKGYDDVKRILGDEEYQKMCKINEIRELIYNEIA